MKIQALLQVKGVFAPFARTKLPVKLSYKLLKFFRAVEVEEQFFNSKIHDIIEEYGEKDEKGNFVLLENGNIKFDDNKKVELETTLKELNDIEVTPPDITFTLEELNELTLSVQDIAIIENFIKEDNND